MVSLGAYDFPEYHMIGSSNDPFPWKRFASTHLVHKAGNIKRR